MDFCEFNMKEFQEETADCFKLPASGELVDKGTLKAVIEGFLYEGECEAMGIQHLLQVIDELPTIEAVPVVHGEIITVVGDNAVMHQECSVCGNVLEWKGYPNYCDECGAKMDGKVV